MTDLARCEKCGYEGVYGVEVVDVDWYSPVTQRDSIALMCRDIEDCYQRELAWDRKSKQRCPIKLECFHSCAFWDNSCKFPKSRNEEAV